MSNTVSPEFLDAFANACNRHDADTIVSMMTDDCVMCLAAGATHQGTRSDGREAVRKTAIGLFERLPDVHWHNARHFIIGDRASANGHLRRLWLRAKSLKPTAVMCYQFRDGLIAVKDSYRKYTG
jgi:taurine dehydrogenase small subunit